MTPRDHQVEGAVWALKTIRDYGLAYLGWKERTGKTLTALLCAELSKAQTCLIVTKVKAIPGWKETLTQWSHSTDFTVINYESIHKLDDNKFDMVILDEAHHAIAKIGTPSKTWRNVVKYTKKKPLLYCSATPYAETVGQLYNQFALSSWSPFLKYTNYIKFHNVYGIPKIVYTAHGTINDRSVFREDEVLSQIEHLFNWKTRQDVGIEHEPIKNLVKVKLSEPTLKLMRDWIDDRVIKVGDTQILGDSDSKVRTVHYQLEGGTIKVDDKITVNIGTEKIDYIKSNYNTEDLAIMAHFIGERELLRKHLPNTTILSSDGDAEGVDLHKIDKLLIYSFSFKTSKFTQRLARQANHNRTKPIVVDILVSDTPAIGMYVYDTVAVKEENFNKNSYVRALKGQK